MSASQATKHNTKTALSGELLESYLEVLRVVESRKRRVRALFKDDNDRVRGEFTIRSQSVEPGVLIDGDIYVDPRLERDSDWLGEVVSELSEDELNSAQLSRKLVRSTRETDEAEVELRSLTARALLELARIGLGTELAVEFSNSGPKRGPVYQFGSIELLAEVGEEYAVVRQDWEAVEAFATFADTVWYYRPSDGMPGMDMVPVVGTQGDSTVDETIEFAKFAEGFLELGLRLRHDKESKDPIAVHHIADDGGFAWVATDSEVALARLTGPRAIAAIGGTSRLVNGSRIWS